jgi:hypothetical protein
MTDGIDLPEKSNLIPWQSVSVQLHADAKQRFAAGTRYEIRLMGSPPFRRICLHRTDNMNQIEPWSNTPEQTETHYRVGRYIVGDA